MKSFATYWNPLDLANNHKWEEVEGYNGQLWQLTLSIDTENGDYTRLTKFVDGANTEKSGPKSHNYPEEIFILSGRLFDSAFDQWLSAGDYASRPPGEVHGPFMADGECLVLEISYPSQSIVE
jgi:quercetin dioxygenase-like cupin family protein